MAASIRSARVEDYPGADWTGLSDSTSAIQAACDYANQTHQPLIAPAGRFYVTKPFRALYGMRALGASCTRIIAHPNARDNFKNGEALLHISYAASEADDLPYYAGSGAAVYEGFTLEGCADFTGTFSADPNNINFNGKGIYLDEMSSRSTIRDVVVNRFMHGIFVNPVGGHINIEGTTGSDNWYGLYMNQGSGDFRTRNNDWTGNFFASMGVSGETDGPCGGGLVGLNSNNDHFGNSPYGIHQKDGPKVVGMLGCTFKYSPFESCGNRAIHLGIATAPAKEVRVSGAVVFDMSPMSLGGPCIQNDSNHPIGDYYISKFQNINNPIIFRNYNYLPTWGPTTSGYDFQADGIQSSIMSNPRQWDCPDASVIYCEAKPRFQEVHNFGKNPQEGKTIISPDFSGVVLGSFEIDKDFDGIQEATFTISCPINNPGPLINGAMAAIINKTQKSRTDYTKFYIPTGQSHLHLVQTFAIDNRAPCGNTPWTVDIATWGLDEGLLAAMIVGAGNIQVKLEAQKTRLL